MGGVSLLGGGEECANQAFNTIDAKTEPLSSARCAVERRTLVWTAVKVFALNANEGRFQILLQEARRGKAVMPATRLFTLGGSPAESLLGSVFQSIISPCRRNDVGI